MEFARFQNYNNNNNNNNNNNIINNIIINNNNPIIELGNEPVKLKET